MQISVVRYQPQILHTKGKLCFTGYAKSFKRKYQWFIINLKDYIKRENHVLLEMQNYLNANISGSLSTLKITYKRKVMFYWIK